MNTSPLLEISGLSAGYGPLHVIHDIELSIFSGQRVGLVGLNGHGKTTFLRALVGLAGWQRGRVNFIGTSVMGLPTHQIIQRGLVLMPQGDALFAGMSVQDNLDTGAFTSESWRTRRQRRDVILELFPPLASRLRQAAGTLSGGERRMLSIGRGLMSRAKVLLIDEPSLGLSPLVSGMVIETLLGKRLDDTTLLIAEQNRALIQDRVDHITLMHGGRLQPLEEAHNRGHEL
jgi:branched-chain amino acid transport system ATP-binding protein